MAACAEQTAELEGGRVLLSDLVDDSGTIRNREFTDTEIVGPGVIVARGCVITGSRWGIDAGGPEAVGWEIDPARESVVGATFVMDCVFRNCRFVNVGFADYAEGLAQFYGASWHAQRLPHRCVEAPPWGSSLDRDDKMRRVSTPHPGTREYRNQTLRIADLTVMNDVIQDVRFETCVLIGPAVLIPLGGVTMTNTQLDVDDPDGAFWLVPETQGRILGAIGLVDVEIYGCRLERVGLAARAVDMPALRAGFDG